MVVVVVEEEEEEGRGGGRLLVLLWREVEIRKRKQQGKHKKGEINEKTEHKRQK